MKPSPRKRHCIRLFVDASGTGSKIDYYFRIHLSHLNFSSAKNLICQVKTNKATFNVFYTVGDFLKDFKTEIFGEIFKEDVNNSFELFVVFL